ncbi:MAG: phosphopantetheine-binding protein [Cyanobacteria bacterium J06641_5]
MWEEVLGVENIELDKSFFELGGDSLTAIAVMFKMERKGLPREVVRGLLQGLSIREIAKRIEYPSRMKKQTHTINDAYTAMGVNINIVRGLLMLFVVGAHWLPGVLNRLPSSFRGLQAILEPLFSLGTPGFAIVYGVTAGYSMFGIYKSDRERCLKYVFSTARILLAGILLRGAFRIGRNLTLGQVENFTDVIGSLYSPLVYFFLITITLPFWFRSVANTKFPIARLIFGGVISYGIYSFFLEPLRSQPTYGLIELAKLSIAGKYAYFNLCAGSLAGMALGLEIRNNVDRKLVGIPNGYVLVSLSSMVAGLVIADRAGMGLSAWVESRNSITLWDWLFYGGLVVLILSVVQQTLHRHYNRINSLVKLGLQYLASVGILAFPIFVIHELLVPAKVILEGFGFPSTLALALALGTVLTIVGFLLKKVHQTSFTWQTDPKV